MLNFLKPTSFRAERSRQEWEASMYDCARSLETMEKDRLTGLVEAIQRYTFNLSLVGPATTSCVGRLKRSTENVSPANDILEIVRRKGTAPNVPEQHLPDFFVRPYDPNSRVVRYTSHITT